MYIHMGETRLAVVFAPLFADDNLQLIKVHPPHGCCLGGWIMTSEMVC
jgi:hypothetical protein